MNHYLLSSFALDLARERSQEAEHRWLESATRAARGTNASFRRLAARLLAAVSRGSAWIVRRLDPHVADDLGRTLAPTN